MAKKKTVVEEVKLQDAPILRGAGDDPEPETEPETEPAAEPAAERKPWVDFIPPYVKDNAKGYPRYVDKLAEALNGVVEGGGGGTDAFDFIIEIVDTVTINDVTGNLDHSYELVTTWEDVVAAVNANKNIYARIKQIQPFPEEYEYTDTNFQTEPVLCSTFDDSSAIGVNFKIPFLGAVWFDYEGDDAVPYEGYDSGLLYDGDFDHVDQYVTQYFIPRITNLTAKISLYDFGSRVQLNLQEAPITDVQSATIPQALRPGRNSGVVANFVRGTDGDPLWTVVNSTGAILVTVGSSVSTTVVGSITWTL